MKIFMQAKRNLANIILYAGLGAVAIYTLFPIYFIVVNSFKGQEQIVKNPLSFPKT